MGRNIIENLNKKKIIYNQYAGSSSQLRNVSLQYTVPSNKSAKINFCYASTLRNNSCGVSAFSMSLLATKKTSNPKFHSAIAIGRAKSSSQQRGQMLSLRPWWSYSEGAGNAALRTGTMSYAWWGIDSSKYMEYTFDGTNNDLSTTSSDNVQDNSYTQSGTPWTNASICDAHKDYIVDAGTQIYFQYYVETNGNPSPSNSNQCDIMFEVEEMEAFA